MNKNDFNSYLYTIMAIVSEQHQGCTGNGLSQHNSTSKNMCFGSMMCKMMMP
ncbi:hypothetical protein QWZ06_08600 [Chryseobacterium tructae]|uniref:Uncharacterized protein n=1 Tax=Chryseobacterium tructae TaxID=1037380 RepID=A0ABV7XXL9_9FLAO|nr:hypothetical protein [Chryseobacterium tructae]MDN3692318.1 hypothetical protein [Chryseobacterium tructae]